MTIVEAPTSPLKPERKLAAAAGTAARLFLRRSLYVSCSDELLRSFGVILITSPVSHGFKKHECVACQNVIIDSCSVRVPCGHSYDVPCLLSLVKASTQDESLFPPRCCQENVPTSIFEKHMDAQLATLFALKTREFSTPKRVYCAKVTCNRFLGPRTKSKGGPLHSYDCKEPGCATRTCSRCRSEVKKHVLHACRPDDVPRRLVQRGCAQQCPGCDRLVELKSGCFHITCACKTQFCYRCGLKWKTCKCPLWEGSLLTGDGPAQLGDGKSKPSLPAPILPPVPRPDRFRQTWIQPSPLPERHVEPSLKRRVRSSAPAQLQGYIHARESVVLRGVQAQERRGKPKGQSQEKCLAPTIFPVSRSTIDTGRLDALEKHIDRLIHDVENYQCQHDWRASLRSTKQSACSCGSSAVYVRCELRDTIKELLTLIVFVVLLSLCRCSMHEVPMQPCHLTNSLVVIMLSLDIPAWLPILWSTICLTVPTMPYAYPLVLSRFHANMRIICTIYLASSLSTYAGVPKLFSLSGQTCPILWIHSNLVTIFPLH